MQTKVYVVASLHVNLGVWPSIWFTYVTMYGLRFSGLAIWDCWDVCLGRWILLSVLASKNVTCIHEGPEHDSSYLR